MDKLEPLLVFGLFLVPSICFYRFCRKSLLPWWRHILFLLPGSQGAALAVILRTMRDFPEESGGARWLVLLLIPLQLGADALLLRLLDRLERGCRARERQAELEQELARMEAYYAGLQKTEQTVRRLRHDINNQLQTIDGLIARGEAARAEAHLERLSALLTEENGEENCHVECPDL